MDIVKYGIAQESGFSKSVSFLYALDILSFAPIGADLFIYLKVNNSRLLVNNKDYLKLKL